MRLPIGSDLSSNRGDFLWSSRHWPLGRALLLLAHDFVHDLLFLGAGFVFENVPENLVEEVFS